MLRILHLVYYAFSFAGDVGARRAYPTSRRKTEAQKSSLGNAVSSKNSLGTFLIRKVRHRGERKKAQNNEGNNEQPRATKNREEEKGALNPQCVAHSALFCL